MLPPEGGRLIPLTDFTPAESLILAQGLKGGERLLERVLYWTAGQPYLTQRLCREAADRDATTAWEIDRLCESLFLVKEARESDDHLRLVRDRILRSEANPENLLNLYLEVRKGRRIRADETNPLCLTLRLAGLVREERGRLQVRNRIYHRVFDREWVRTHLPAAELRPRQASYRRGLRRAVGFFKGWWDAWRE